MTLSHVTTDDEDRLAALLREVWPELAAYTRHRAATLGLGVDKVEDLMQGAAADLIQTWHTRGEQQRGKAVAMLKQSVKTDAIDLARKRGRRRTDSLAELDDHVLLQHLDRTGDTDHEILALLGRIDHERLVRQLPVLLDERQRAAIVAVHIDGATQAQAAEELGITVRALQMRLAKATQQLRRHLDAGQPTPAPALHPADPTTRETPR